MIRLVGIRRIFAILLLLGLVVLLMSYTLVLAKPGLRKAQQELIKHKADIAEMTSNIDKLTQGIERFTTQKDYFEQIQKFGFFDPQNRVEARRRLNLMQKESRLLSAKYTIKQAIAAKSEKAAVANYKVLDTEIAFTFEALEDIDIYNFIYLLNYGFPGQIAIEELSISRDQEITQPLLRNIGIGDYEPLVKGELKVIWTTMVPEDSVADGGDQQ